MKIIEQIWKRSEGWVEKVDDAPLPREQEGSFTVYIRHSEGIEASSVHINFHNSHIVHALKSFYPNEAALYDRQPGLDARILYLDRDRLSQDAPAGLVEILSWVQCHYKEQEDKLRSLPAGLISWPLLWMIFGSVSEIETGCEFTNERVALTVDSWQYAIEAGVRAFILRCSYPQWSGHTFQRMETSRRIPEFHNLRALKDLSFMPLHGSRSCELSKRGQIYLLFARLAHLNYNGRILAGGLGSLSPIVADGHAMVDVSSYRKSNTTMDRWKDDFRTDSEHKHEPIEPHLLPPFLHGFSFTAKKWGLLSVKDLSEIVWSRKAFDDLVLPEVYRQTIRSLVEVHSSPLKDKLLKDVVAGKGDALVIAIHGRPGTGKTLTAEAIAEYLRRPLYYVSAGELVNIQTLERQLKEIFSMAEHWKSVLLIDEADIFLEKRDTAHLERNALVGIFLRLIEYFSGVVVLTTNRIDRFDEAFLSRFSLSLHFEDLDRDSRQILWQRFLSRTDADVSADSIYEISAVQMSGRDIKQNVRTAQALALVANEPITVKHLRMVIQMHNSAHSI